MGDYSVYDMLEEREMLTQLIDRLFDALGGREQINLLESLAISANCSGPDGAFQTWVQSHRPDRAYFRQKSARGEIEIWCVPGRVYTKKEDSDVQELPPAMRSFVRGHEFHLLLFELETRFSDFRLVGEGVFEGETCYSIDMVDEDGNPAGLHISPATHLPIALEMNPPQAEGTITVRFSNWKEIEGLNYFHSFVLTEGPKRTFTYQYEQISPNSVALDLFD